MSNNNPTPETPWEFIPDDDIRDEMASEEPPPAEADAMHVETAPPRFDPDLDLAADKPAIRSDEVVHYFPDEDPEVPDTSEPEAAVGDETPEVEELLIRQHYLPADDADDADSDMGDADQLESD